MSRVRVNNRVKRFSKDGILGLQTKPGQGCKSLLDSEDKADLQAAVKFHRQRLRTAKAEWEASRGQSASEIAMCRFLKVLTEDINA
ncbi:MAG: hypothetical protein LBL90_00975 [Prevotellaceae bacterium]|jgi:transposase|nr:hypothetical protein [Prevotellaceae bacterium]